jgi:hypothetical protein
MANRKDSSFEGMRMTLDMAVLNNLAMEAGSRMREFVFPIVTPLVVVRAGKTEPLGTGSFFRFFGQNYVLTAEHVARNGAGGIIQHLPGPHDRFSTTGAFMTERMPFDLALAKATSLVSLPPRALDSQYAPVDDTELFFFLGFPGSTARRMEPITEANIRREYFGTFPTEGLPFIAQAVRPAERPGYDPMVHAAFKYPALATHQSGARRAIPNPQGLSGSLLWDTNRVHAWRRGIPWRPEMARVCGVIHSDFDEDEFIVATKVEHVSAALLQMLRRERAYLHWRDRGSPIGDDLTDWIWAEQTFQELGSDGDDPATQVK